MKKDLLESEEHWELRKKRLKKKGKEDNKRKRIKSKNPRLKQG